MGFPQKGHLARTLVCDQIQRACVSIMANIAEGFGRNGATEFIRYLTIAQSSAIEVQSHLYIALDLHYISQPDFERLYGLVESFAN
jgi:four helix bundle protein